MSPKDTMRLRAADVLCSCDTSGIGESLRMRISGPEKPNPAAFLGTDQKRFENALSVGIKSGAPSLNIFISGVSGANGFAAAKHHISRIVKEQEKTGGRRPSLNDWVYVYNFKDPRSPVPIPLRSGESRRFAKAIASLLRKLRQRIPQRLEDNDIFLRRETLQNEYDAWFLSEQSKMENRAKELGHTMLVETRKGFQSIKFVPAEAHSAPTGNGPDRKTTAGSSKKKAGKASPHTKSVSGVSEKRDQDAHKSELTMMLHAFLKENAKQAKQVSDKVARIDEEAARETIAGLFEKLNVSSGDGTLLGSFLGGLREHAEEHWELFTENGDKGRNSPLGGSERDPFLPWRINIFVENGETEGIPIIAERLASIGDLVGRIDYRGMMGVTFTNHTMVVSGAVARANGGFIIVNAEDIASVPGLWQALKQCVKNGENSFDMLALFESYGASQLKPVPIPLDVRFVLFGPRELMETIAHYDGDVYNVFPLRADITPSVARTPQEVLSYCEWMHDFATEEKLVSPSPEALGALIEHAGRMAMSQRHLSTDFAHIELVMREASVIARQENADVVTRKHVQDVLAARLWRSDAVSQYMRDLVERKYMLISVSGKAVGRINGLTVSSYGDVDFGFPKCMTAVASVGRPGILNIARDAKMSGATMDKADETVQGVLEKRFAHHMPLALKVRFSLEQLYGMADGDSASLAEYFAILSAIAEIPLSQSIAVTGSLNLLGEVQPIGGVNEKIEGFFDVCRACGELSGEQGAIIPWQNKEDLMLREDVVQAVEHGKFHVWAIRTLDDGMEILTDMEAGLPDDSGVYPDGTLNAKVSKAIEGYAERARKFMELSKKE